MSSVGAINEVMLIASSIDHAHKQAIESGIRVVDIRPVGWRISLSSRESSLDLGLLTHEVVSLLRAGLSLIETLEALIEREHVVLRDLRILSSVLARIREGQPFSRALSEFPEEFPNLFVASVAASEQTGDLVESLERYLRYHAQATQIRQKILSASLYPILLMVAGAAVGLFLLCYLVPRFSEVYNNINTELPFMSRWLMHWGQWVNGHWQWVLAGGVGSVTSFVLLLKRPAVRFQLKKLITGNRWIGPKVRLGQLSRFYRALGLLLSGGIPIVKAMQMVRALLPAAQSHALEKAISDVEEGKRLSIGLLNNGLTTSVALRLLRVGERNGQISNMLEQVALFHDAEVTQWIDRFSRLFEPLLMIVIGLVIGAIVILLYLPIFDLAGSLQ
ncbi:type II secretion system F family protein [Pseudomonas azotoformans]|uniref:type II secretion system F family protein n=1 Tax=Pseudomonas azotoformans TaxID=47878 RepID=UPI001F32DCE9|nr:type II secretion system F family protein [Pseudomonas azotoformans]